MKSIKRRTAPHHAASNSTLLLGAIAAVSTAILDMDRDMDPELGDDELMTIMSHGRIILNDLLNAAVGGPTVGPTDVLTMFETAANAFNAGHQKNLNELLEEDEDIVTPEECTEIAIAIRERARFALMSALFLVYAKTDVEKALCAVTVTSQVSSFVAEDDVYSGLP